MLEMLVVANSAFEIIKKTLENGRELHSAGSAIANFVGAEDQLQQDLNKKKNSIWTNFLGYTDYIQYCADARKARKEARIKSAKRKQHIQDTIMKVILAILITAVLSGAVAALFLIAKKKGLI